ncbi:MAG: RDD family protein [Fimbriimonadaceae bacterium]|nr:RDD family protein [Fimbriimonadaceae bacterium]
MTDRHLVLTPEKVLISYEVARLSRRISAKIVDLILLVGLILVAMLAFGSLANVFGPDAIAFLQLPLIILLSFSPFIYFALFEIIDQGRTPGKRLAKIRTCMVDGTPLKPVAAIYRNLLLVADFTPPVGLIALFLTPSAQRVGDLAAGTLVLAEAERSSRIPPAPHRYGVHPMEPAVGELRGMTLEEYEAIKRLTDRFPDLPGRIQDEKVREVWEPFATRMKITNPPGVHPVYLMEAVVMKFSRQRNLV